MTHPGVFTTVARGLCAVALGCIAVDALAAQTEPVRKAPAAAAAASAPARVVRKVSPFQPQKQSTKASHYYATAWGVDKMKVSSTSSGNLIRFSYRVSDPERAKALADKKSTPYLMGQKSRALLQVPVMDKVGMLRQTGAPLVGQEYWMVFSNKGNLVRPGDRVNVMIGSFHADGLVVE